jgi:hypothetical protein
MPIAVAFGVDRSTVTRPIGQVRPLLATRGYALPSGVRLRTLADVFAVAADEHGATLWCGSTRPGRTHDTTAARVEGIDALLQTYPQVNVLVDAGYQGCPLRLCLPTNGPIARNLGVRVDPEHHAEVLDVVLQRLQIPIEVIGARHRFHV